MSQNTSNYNKFMSDLYDRVFEIKHNESLQDLEKRQAESDKKEYTEEDRDFFIGYIYEANKDLYGYKMNTSHLEDKPISDLKREADDMERSVVYSIAEDDARKTVEVSEIKAVKNNPTAKIAVVEDYHIETHSVHYENRDDVENFRLILEQAEEEVGQKIDIDLDQYKPEVEVKSAMQLAFENASNKNRSRRRPGR